MVEVVLPTPPFWLTMAMTRAGPWEDSGAGSGNSRWGRPVGPITASSRSSSVPSRVAEPCSLLTYLSTLSMTVISCRWMPSASSCFFTKATAPDTVFEGT